MAFTRTETLMKAQEMHSTGKYTLQQITELMNKDGYKNSNGDPLAISVVHYMLRKGDDADTNARRKIVIPEKPVPVTTAKTDIFGKMCPGNPTEGKVILAIQMLQTKDLHIERRCTMAVELLLS